MVQTLWDSITEFLSPEAGQRRTQALQEFGEDVAYYVPPELRGRLGLLAQGLQFTDAGDMTAAAEASRNLVKNPSVETAADYTAAGLGLAIPFLSSRAMQEGVDVTGDAIQSLLGDVRSVRDRLNQPGPVPTMYSNPIDFKGQSKAYTESVFGTKPAQPDRSIRQVADNLIEGGEFENLPSQSVSVSQIVPTQRFLGAENMERVSDATDDTGAFLLKQGDQYFVLDGHHRIAKNIAEGRGEINAKVFEAPPPLPAPRNDAEAMAREVLEMRAAGRAAEVTEEMMAAADPQYMFANTPLPMDEASRMARADKYFPDDAYHVTGKDFQYFIPSEIRGASFFGATPEGASRGATASANEGVGSGSSITIPARVNTSGVEGLGAYGRKDMNEFWASLPDRLYTETEMDALMASDAAPLRGDWTYFFDDLTDYDALRRFREVNPDAPIPEGIIKYRPKQKLSYGPDLRSDISGKQFAHYSEGMSEKPISDYTKSIGNTGFTMMDESGLALAMTDPTKIRSRFARFDPEFAHLRNLSAGVAGGGLLATQDDQQQREDEIRQYLGGLL